MNFIEELQWRGLVKDCTDKEGLGEQLKNPTTIYCGFDLKKGKKNYFVLTF